MFDIGFSLVFVAVAPKNQREQLDLAREFAGRGRDGVKARSVGLMLWARGLVHLDWGERAEAEALFAELYTIAESSRDSNLLPRKPWVESLTAYIDGDLGGALYKAEETTRLAEECGVAAWGRLFAAAAALRPLVYLGRASEALDAWARVGDASSGNPVGAAAQMVALAHLGRFEEACGLLNELLARVDVATPETEQWGTVGIAFLETAVLLGDKELAGRLLDSFAAMAPLSMQRTDFTTPARHLGAAAALVGNRSEAMRYYEQALETAGKIRFRPEIALTHLGIAELLLGEVAGGFDTLTLSGVEGAPTDAATDGGSVGARHAVPNARACETPAPPDPHRAEALGHLDFAIAEFREMKMQPSLERALRHKEVLKA